MQQMTQHIRDEKVLEPYHYIGQILGKNVRGVLIDCFQEWLPIADDKMEIIKDIIASLHNASLLVDDIEDSSKLRRGVPCAHSIYGVASTMNCANYVYFLALEKCHSLQSRPALNVFVLELLNLHRGQGQDILWREECRCPSEDQYRQMVLDKTGGLFRLAVGLMESFLLTEDTVGDDVKTERRDYTCLLNKLSLYFQIRDDLLNVSNVAYMQTKSFCEDLTEGKFSFPVIHSVNSRPEDTRLLNILRQRTEDVEVKKHAVQWMVQTGSLKYTRDTLKVLHSEVLREIHNLGGHPRLSALINNLDSQLDVGDDDSNNQNFTKRPNDINHIDKSSNDKVYIDKKFDKNRGYNTNDIHVSANISKIGIYSNYDQNNNDDNKNYNNDSNNADAKLNLDKSTLLELQIAKDVQDAV